MRALIIALGLLLYAVAVQAQNLLPNPDFEAGANNLPSGWSVEGVGTWETDAHRGKHAAGLTAKPGQETAYWRCPTTMLRPGKTYRFAFWVKGVGASNGCVISGPAFVNRDFGAGDKWEECSFIFLAPTGAASSYLRLGLWNMKGKLLFDDVTLEEVAPVNELVGQRTLAAGEELAGTTYRFKPDFAGEGSNYSPLLVGYTCGFNSNRWPFGPGTDLVFRQGVPGVMQTAAKVTVNIGYYAGGTCVIEASRDGQAWTPVGTISKLTGADFDLPAALFPAEQVYVRMRSPGQNEPRAEAAPGNFQIHNYAYEAHLAQEVGEARGATHFLRVSQSSPNLAVTVQSLGALRPGGDNAVRLTVRNTGDESLDLRALLDVTGPGRPESSHAASDTKPLKLAPGQETPLSLSYRVEEAGPGKLTLALSGQASFAASTEFVVPALYAADYGELVQPENAHAPAVWWCGGTYKVSRDRPAPQMQGGKLRTPRLSLAGNEFEPVQVVVRSGQGLKGLTASVSNPTNLPGLRWTVARVAYHFVTRPSDKVGCVGWWPDALPLLKEPLDVPANQNQPLWLTAYAPAGTKPGTYRATLNLSAQGWTQQVPLEVTIYGFSLSETRHLESGFGLSEGPIARYHNLKSMEDRRKVWDLYMQNFRDHRQAPYSFAAYDNLRVSLTGGAEAWQGGEYVADNSADGRQCLKIADDSTTSVVQVDYRQRLPVEKGVTYRLSFKCRTAQPGQRYLVTLGQHRADGSWLSGNNLDLPYTGDVTWKTEEYVIRPERLNPETTQLSLTLRPAPWSAKGEQTGTAWFDDLYFGPADGQANLLKDPGFESTPEAITVSADFSAFDREAEKYLDGYHFQSFRLSMMNLAGMSFNAEGTGRIGPFKQGTPEYARLYKQAAQLVQEHLRQKGWLRKGYVYWFDEPEPKDYPFVKAGMELLKAAAPDTRRMLTEQPEPELFGAVDIWCPVESCLVPEKTAARQKAGETIWWYVCTGPKEPWPGLFIDHSALDLRMWLWLTVKYNVQGILIWTTNWWTSSAAFPKAPQNPWADPMGYVDGYGFQPGQTAYWGNGDGRMLYPPNQDVNNDRQPYVEGPVTSIRWEMIRDGSEDYEYFYELRQAVAAARKAHRPGKLIAEAEGLLVVPAAIAVDGTHWTSNPELLTAHRAKVARMIEKLR